MPNRTIYLTKEQDADWERYVACVRALDENVGGVCIDALRKFSEQNADVMKAVTNAKQRKEKLNDAKPEV